MKKCAIILAILFAVAALPAPGVEPTLAHTYSIVAIDKERGEMGAAVQSHAFSAGMAIWAEAGVGAVCTQSFVELSYGPLGLDLMRAGKTAEESLAGLLKADKSEAIRQVAMLDNQGRVAAYTGKDCIPEAGHYIGNGFSCQANLMLKNSVWNAMAKAFENTSGELVERLMAALEAAEREGGDIRGRQSAAILVVNLKSSGAWWDEKLYDLRVDDNPEPLAELRRLIGIKKAYNALNGGRRLIAEKKFEEAMRSFAQAMELYPENAEIALWAAVRLAGAGKVDESLLLFRKAFAMDKNLATLVTRLPQVGLLPDDKGFIEKILAQASQKR